MLERGEEMYENNCLCEIYKTEILDSVVS
jgi:hypothetical protein